MDWKLLNLPVFILLQYQYYSWNNVFVEIKKFLTCKPLQLSALNTMAIMCLGCFICCYTIHFYVKLIVLFYVIAIKWSCWANDLCLWSSPLLANLAHFGVLLFYYMPVQVFYAIMMVTRKIHHSHNHWSQINHTAWYKKAPVA